MNADPAAVALKFAFLGVLYLFLLIIARSALKDLRGGGSQAFVPPEGTGMHAAVQGGRVAATDAELIAVTGGGLTPGERIDVFGGVTIGRGADADVRIEDRFASGIHCRVHNRGNAYFVEDLDSTNGTYLNGADLQRRVAAERHGRDQDRRHRVPIRALARGRRLMLRIAEAVQITDTGRQREANEDSYFAGPPLFAVADGMGGAQAGEVASQIAVEAFAGISDDGEAPPEDLLRRTAQDANQKIFDLAQGDETRSGMGTTLTAALVRGDEISFGHVGDSRAYVFRDGKLKQITNDHSLVEELRRQGRLTRDQAAEHPQRSVITRALGPEPQVQVDTMTFRAQPGDVFMLCSDGLTTMLSDEDLLAVLSREADLDRTARRLVKAANDRGGRDNITVVLFRLEGADEGAEEPTGRHEEATLIGAAAAEEGFTADAVRAGAAEHAASSARRRRPAHVATSTASASGRRWPRRLLKGGVALLVLAALAFGAVIGARQIWFLGTDDGGRIALYRGLPYDLPFGIELYSQQDSIPVTLQALPEERRAVVTDHELRSEDDAVSLVEDLQNAADAAAATEPATGQGGGGSTAGGASGGGAGSGQGSGSQPPGGGSG